MAFTVGSISIKFFSASLPPIPPGNVRSRMTDVESFAGFEFFTINVHTFESAFGLRDLIPEPFQGKFDQSADRFLVIDDEDAAGTRK